MTKTGIGARVEAAKRLRRLKAFSRVPALTVAQYPDSHDLNFSNRPVRIRMRGGVAGALSAMAAPYAG